MTPHTPPAAPTDSTINPLRALVEEFRKTEEKLRLGGGLKAIERQHEKGRLTARERVEKLVDDPKGFVELGLWAAHGMYEEYGGAAAAGVVTGVGPVAGREAMIIANDATVKAGAFFPMTCKKIIRAQTIAMMARLPLIYLVDSAGVFLPLQEDVFPDTDDFGRIFRNNAVISAAGIPQVAAIMGYCVAGGGYLPVLCDTLLMTEGSGLYLAGPALVKAAIGQEVSDEELGGAEMHAAVSGTIDFKETDDDSCLARVRSLMGKYGRETERLRDEETKWGSRETERLRDEETKWGTQAGAGAQSTEHFVSSSLRLSVSAARNPEDIYSIFTDKAGAQYDVKDIIACLVDAKVARLSEPGSVGNDEPKNHGSESQGGKNHGSKNHGSESRATAPDFDEYKAEYGQSIVCGYARIGGRACGIVANQKKLTQRTMPGGKAGPSKSVNMPGVIYDDSADKAARFIMDCNQRKIPLIFLQDTTGFMVGRDSEQGGIIRAGAKMVNAMANSIVPKIALLLGGSYGAGNYAMCGRAFDPFLTYAWPSAKFAVMGANQATGTLAMIEEKRRWHGSPSRDSSSSKGKPEDSARSAEPPEIDRDTHEQILKAVHASYTAQQDIRYAAARGWVDRIIEPQKTREELIAALGMTGGWDYSREFKTGVLQT